MTLCYPENDKTPFFDMLSGKLTRIVVRVDLVQIDTELHGDYVNDKNFKRRFQLWLNTLWKEKDEQIENIKASNKTPVIDRRFISLGLLLLDQVFHGVCVLLYEDIHAAGVHALHVQLIFAVNIHRRNALELQIGCGFFLLSNQRFHDKAVPRGVVVFTFHACVNEHFTNICCGLDGLGFLHRFKHREVILSSTPSAIATAHA